MWNTRVGDVIWHVYAGVVLTDSGSGYWGKDVMVFVLGILGGCCVFSICSVGTYRGFVTWDVTN